VSIFEHPPPPPECEALVQITELRATYRVELRFKQKTGQWIMTRIVIVILIYNRHKHMDLTMNVVGASQRTMMVYHFMLGGSITGTKSSCYGRLSPKADVLLRNLLLYPQRTKYTLFSAYLLRGVT
jgi:hypothetical protein